MASPEAGRGLAGYRFLLAVALLVGLSSGPTLLLVTAGATALSNAPAPAASPFMTYPAGPVRLPPVVEDHHDCLAIGSSPTPG